MNSKETPVLDPKDFTSEFIIKFIDMKKLWELLQKMFLTEQHFPGYFSPLQFEILSADKTKKAILYKHVYKRNDDTLSVVFREQCLSGEGVRGDSDFSDYSESSKNFSKDFFDLMKSEFSYSDLSTNIITIKKFLS